MIRVAAAGDLHFGEEMRGQYRAHLADVSDHADLLLLAGDLTKCGSRAEAEVAAAELSDIGVPAVAVLGNHDYHGNEPENVAGALRDAGVRVLEGESVELDIAGARVGIAGTKGFGGGFAGACGTDFGEPEMKAFVWHTRDLVARFEEALNEIAGADVRLALMHYSPIRDTLVGEPLEIYPFLGSFMLAEAVDRVGADLAFHGHAHKGTEKGVTSAGINVRNVALPVIHHAYNLYEVASRTAPLEAAAG